jgi:hypothetical protein
VASTFSLHVGIDPPADARQGVREGHDPRELVGLSRLPEIRVVAVLLAALGIAAGRLDVAVAAGADPDIRVGRRDRQRADAGELRLVAHRGALRVEVAEAGAAAAARQARPAIIDVDEAGLRRRRTEVSAVFRRLDTRHAPPLPSTPPG